VNVVILGASDNQERYSYKAAETLLAKGFKIVPVGQKNKSIFGHSIQSEIPNNLNPTILTLYVGPNNQVSHFENILRLRPLKVIFNPGTENEILQDLLDQNHIPWEHSCTLVKLSLNQFP